MAITDPAATAGLVEAANRVVAAGVPALQLRWKGATARQLLAIAEAFRPTTSAARTLLILNDRLDVALAAGADGVHLGDDDIPLHVARRLAPTPFLIGRSVDTPEEAVAAERAGADYLGAGPVFATGSKLDTGPVLGLDGFARVCRAVSVPVVGIGGVAAANAADVFRAGAAGVAVLGAVMFAGDPGEAVKGLMREVRGLSSRAP